MGHSIIKMILTIYRSSLGYIGPRCQDFGIGRGQWYFINSLLFEDDAQSQDELSKSLVVDRAHTARAMSDLEKKDFIYRSNNKDDARKKIVYITKKTRDMEKDYHAIYKDLNQILLKDFTQKEIKQVKDLLDRMEKNIKNYMEEDQ